MGMEAGTASACDVKSTSRNTPTLIMHEEAAAPAAPVRFKRRSLKRKGKVRARNPASEPAEAEEEEFDTSRLHEKLEDQKVRSW